MKKFLSFGVIFLFLVLALSGCSCKEGQSTWNCFKEKVGLAEQQVCNFVIADSQVAQDGINFISAVMPIVGTVFGVNIDPSQATAILTNVVTLADKGGCMALQDLQQALNFVDKLTAQYNHLVESRSVKLKGLKVIPNPPNMTSMRAKAIMK